MPRKRTPRKVRGIRRPEQVASGAWRARTYNPVTKKYGLAKDGQARTFDPDQYAQAATWLAQAQAELNASLAAGGHDPAVATPGGHDDDGGHGHDGGHENGWPPMAAANQVAMAMATVNPVANPVATRSNSVATGVATPMAMATARPSRLLAAAIIEWAEGAGETHNTRRANKTHARSLATLWPDKSVEEITSADVRRMIADIKIAGLSQATATARLVVLSKFMLAEIEAGHRTAGDPTAGIRRGRWVPHREPRVPTDAEIEAVMAEMPECLRPIVLLARGSGLREGEICALRPRHLDLHGERNAEGIPSAWIQPIVLDSGIEQKHPKGKVPAWVPLTDRTVDALVAHLARYPCGPDERMFRKPRSDQPVTPIAIRMFWGRARILAGLTPPLPGFHGCRHALGHAMHRDGVHPRTAQRAMRHSDLETTSKLYMPEVELGEVARAIRAAPTLPPTRPTAHRKLRIVRDDDGPAAVG